jgi:3-hydroxyisobutyrate dehydrogenase-like beta-hydroxyacid dehydrogenase
MDARHPAGRHPAGIGLFLGAKTVGIVGLGLMGRALAERLLENHLSVRGYDIDAARTREAAIHGVVPSPSIADLGRSVDFAILAVFDGDQAQTALGEIPSGLPVLCVTTCEPDRAAQLARGRPRFIELPLSGTSAQVRAGGALGLVAGDAAVIADAAPLLDAICPRRFILGSAGTAARAKLAVNLVLQLNRAALAEGLVFAERLGIAAPAFLEVLKASAAYSAVMDAKGEKMAGREYSPDSRLAQTMKDAELIRKEAERCSLELPLARANLELLARAVLLCGPDADPAAVIEPLRSGAKR